MKTPKIIFSVSCQQLATISATFDPLDGDVVQQEGQVIALLDKIRCLKNENDRIVGEYVN